MASNSKFPSWIRHSSAGLELAGGTAGLALTGYWLDGKFDTRPWGLLGGMFIGIVGGLYNLVRDSLRAAREAAQEDAALGPRNGERGAAKKDGTGQ
jgi:F0F1-type ATP synthase assembly protein I